MTKQVDTLGLPASARLLLTALGLLAIAAGTSCGSESSNPRDASADRGAGGTGGVSVDGGNHDVASDSQPAGMGGTNDAGVPETAGEIVDSGTDVAPETCGPGGQGCARLSVPLTDPQTGTFFAVSIPATDLTGVSAVFRFCLVSSAVQGSGWLQPYAQEGVAPYAGQYDVVPFTSIPACPSFLDYTFNFSDAPDPSSDAGSPWFTRVQNIGLKIQSLAGATGSWANPTVIYVDSIMLDRRTPDAGAPDDGGALDDAGAPDDGGALNDAGAPQDDGATQDSGLSEDGGDAPDAGTSNDGSAPAPLPGPFTFDTSSSPFGISSYLEVPGSGLDWVP